MKYLIMGFLAMLASWGLGAYLDISQDFPHRVIYWLIGAIGGIVASAIVAYGATK